MNQEVQDAYLQWLLNRPVIRANPEEIASKQKDCQHVWINPPFPFCAKCGISQDIWMALANHKVGDLPRKRFPF